jgi:hypothetical protein
MDGRMVVGIDGSVASRYALEWAVAEVHVVHRAVARIGQPSGSAPRHRPGGVVHANVK